jgi:uncharacterized UBP type Zn finger protein
MTTHAPAAAKLEQCTHLSAVRNARPHTNAGCEDCLRQGSSWMKLRVCMTCGHVGCCDSSEGKHATGHWKESGHPLAASFELGETWAWCYEDRVMLDACELRREACPPVDPGVSFSW